MPRIKPLTKADLEQAIVRKDRRIDQMLTDLDDIDRSRDRWRLRSEDKDQKIIALLEQHQVQMGTIDRQKSRIKEMEKEITALLHAADEREEHIGTLQQALDDMANRLDAVRIASAPDIPFPPSEEDILRAMGLEEVGKIAVEPIERDPDGTVTQVRDESGKRYRCHPNGRAELIFDPSLHPTDAFVQPAPIEWDIGGAFLEGATLDDMFRGEVAQGANPFDALGNIRVVMDTPQGERTFNKHPDGVLRNSCGETLETFWARMNAI